LFTARGLLPPGALADTALAIARARAGLLRSGRDAFAQGAAPTRCEGTLAFDNGMHLAGTVTDVYPNGLLRADPGKLDGKRALRAWIDTLFVAVSSGEATGCRLLWLKDDETPRQFDIAAVDPDRARTQLEYLLGLVHDGLRRPLPFVAGASWDSLKRWRTQKGEAPPEEFAEHLRTAAAKADDDFGGRSDFDGTAMRIAWRGVDLANASPLDDWYHIAGRVLPRFEGVPVKHGDAP
jgi:exonuclease V gamma subunit